MSLEADAIAALRALMTSPCAYLEDHHYEIREREGKGWDGPAVKAWGKAMEDAKDVLRRADNGGAGK